MIRKRLIELRGSQSLEDVAKALDISHQMLSAIERGSRTPSLPLALKIAKYYGQTIEEIFFAHNCNESLQSCAHEQTAVSSA